MYGLYGLSVRVDNLFVRSAGSQSKTSHNNLLMLVDANCSVLFYNFSSYYLNCYKTSSQFSLLGLCHSSLYFVPLKLILSSRM